MTRFLTLDHAYSEAFAALPHATHEEWFEKGVFGTSDFLDVALRAAGHEAKTLVANFFEKPQWPGATILAHAEELEPDVVVCREAARWPGELLRRQFPNAKLVCTCSHRVDDSCLQGFDCVFTSFPWFVEHVRSLGIKCEYLPLAFGKPVLDRVQAPPERDIPVCFIGGLGMRTWKSGTETMAKIAEACPEFVWHGYFQSGFAELPPSLQRSYRGEAWGADMYRLLMRTKILVNRHGEIARGWGNNCRQWESGGAGCVLLTDARGEHESCFDYENTEHAVGMVQAMLKWQPQALEVGGNLNRKFVLEKGCYEHRVPRFLEVVESL